MKLFSDYLEELEHPVEQLADFPTLEKDVAVASYLECQRPNQLFNKLVEAWFDYDPDGESESMRSIMEEVRDGKIDKAQALDRLMNCLYQSCESDINDEIDNYNEA